MPLDSITRKEIETLASMAAGALTCAAPQVAWALLRLDDALRALEQKVERAERLAGREG